MGCVARARIVDRSPSQRSRPRSSAACPCSRNRVPRRSASSMTPRVLLMPVKTRDTLHQSLVKDDIGSHDTHHFSLRCVSHSPVGRRKPVPLPRIMERMPRRYSIIPVGRRHAGWLFEMDTSLHQRNKADDQYFSQCSTLSNGRFSGAGISAATPTGINASTRFSPGTPRRVLNCASRGNASPSTQHAP